MDPQTDDDLRPLPTVRQLADVLGVHPITVYKAIAEGDIAAIRFRGRLRIPRREWRRLTEGGADAA
jgi:excisionase family DNA binding protein